MTTLVYSAFEYNVVYIDPTIVEAGDGSTPALALKDLPTVLTEGTCYFMRRTNEIYNLTLTKTGNVGLKHIMFLGMPKEGDEFYNLATPEAIEAWGSDATDFEDTGPYSNILCNSASYTNEDTTNVVFYESQITSFTAVGCYFLRNALGGTASSYLNYMFWFNNADTSVVFEDCKFGYTQYDFDNDDFIANNTNIAADSTKYPQYKCQMYVYTNNCKIVSFDRCVINWVQSYGAGNTENYHRPEGNVFFIDRCREFNLTRSTINKYFYDRLSENRNDRTFRRGIVVMKAGSITNPGDIIDTGTDRSYEPGLSIYDNLKINLIFSSTNYCDGRVILDDNTSVVCENVDIELKTMKNMVFNSFTNNIDTPFAILSFCDNRNQVRIRNINIDATTNPNCKPSNLPVLWVMNPPVVAYGNPQSFIKNINAKFSDTPTATCFATDTFRVHGTYFGYAQGTNPQYSTSTDYQYMNKNPAKSYIVDDINIDCKANKNGFAISLVRASGRAKNVYGRVYLDSATLDVEKIYNPNPSSMIYVYNNSFLKCDEYIAEPTLYTGQRQMEIDYWQGAAAWIGKSNSILFNEVYGGSVSPSAFESYVICPNYIMTGQLYARNNGVLCRSWNTARTGSTASSSLRFNANWVSDPHPLVIGADPCEGIHVTPRSIGNKILTCYVAMKNFDSTKFANCSSYCGINVYVPETIGEGEDAYKVRHLYTSAGCWRADDSTWSNESDLTVAKIVIPIEVKEITSDIDVKIWYNWYDVHGFVYFDPDIKLTDVD